MTSPDEVVLAADVGATKTTLAVVTAARGPWAPLATATLRSADYDGLLPLLARFLADTALTPTRGCLGVPGPVVDGTADLTNLGWRVDAAAIASQLRWRSVVLLNDVQATAAAVPHLRADDVRTLHHGRREARGAIAVVAPGSGLGEAYLTWDGQRYRAWPTEGGHTDFGPRNDEQIALLGHLRERHDHVSYERVCSGWALPDIYAFHRDSGRFEEDAAMAEACAVAADPTPLIVRSALDETAPCPLCRAALATFVDVLAAEAGNLALKVVATGGVYLGGGMPARVLPLLETPSFLATFRDKGRYRDLLARMPVHVIVRRDAALLGAAIEALADRGVRG